MVCSGGVDIRSNEALQGATRDRERRGGAWERRREMFSTHEISFEFMCIFLSTCGPFT
jgi:hypothetical protein